MMKYTPTTVAIITAISCILLVIVILLMNNVSRLAAPKECADEPISSSVSISLNAPTIYDDEAILARYRHMLFTPDDVKELINEIKNTTWKNDTTNRGTCLTNANASWAVDDASDDEFIGSGTYEYNACCISHIGIRILKKAKLLRVEGNIEVRVYQAKHYNQVFKSEKCRCVETCCKHCLCQQREDFAQALVYLPNTTRIFRAAIIYPGSCKCMNNAKK